MAMDRNDDLGMTRPNSMADRDPTLDSTHLNSAYDRDTVVYDRDTGGSNFLAFLIGGLVIAVGLLAFLFYDGGNSRDVTTTGSTTPRIERPASPATPMTPAKPAPTAPAAPAPSAPATPQ
jgi:hypothetical protein